MSYTARRAADRLKRAEKSKDMRIRIKKGYWEDAIRIELHIQKYPPSRNCFVNEKYRKRVEELKKEGLVRVYE